MVLASNTPRSARQARPVAGPTALFLYDPVKRCHVFIANFNIYGFSRLRLIPSIAKKRKISAIL